MRNNGPSGADSEDCSSIVVSLSEAAHQRHDLGSTDELAFVQLANRGFVDLAGGAVEAGKVPV